MSIDIHQLMAWFSPSFPIGAFSYSHGLEQVMADDQYFNAAKLESWIKHVLLKGSGRNDAILLVQSYQATDSTKRLEIVDLALALSAGGERHMETLNQGTAFAKTASAVLERPFVAGAFPTVVGDVAKDQNIDLEQVVRAYLHAFVANLVSAAVRFVPLGQVEGQKVLNALFPDIDGVAGEALTSTIADLGSSCLLADLASISHETLEPRIFRT